MGAKGSTLTRLREEDEERVNRRRQEEGAILQHAIASSRHQPGVRRGGVDEALDLEECGGGSRQLHAPPAARVEQREQPRARHLVGGDEDSLHFSRLEETTT